PIATSHLLENLDLALGEGLVTVMLSQAGRDLGWNALLTRMDLSDDLYQFLRRHALEDIGASSCFEGPLNLHVAGKCCQNDDPGLWKFRPYCHHRIDAAHVRKP